MPSPLFYLIFGICLTPVVLGFLHVINGIGNQ